MNYEDALKRVKGSTWLHASKSLSKTPFDTPADRWEAWSTILVQYDKVTAEQVAISWLRSFFPDDPLLGSHGDVMVYRALHKHPHLVKDARRMGVPVRRIMNEVPPRLESVLKREEKTAKKVGKQRKLKVVVGEAFEEAPQPRNITVQPPMALFVDLVLLGKKPIKIEGPTGEIREIVLGKLLRGYLENGASLEQVVELAEVG